jgi:hypothetical protein
MSNRPLHRYSLLLGVNAASCAPLPMHVYVPHAGNGTVQYSTCAFNSHVPAGVTFEVAGVGAVVYLGEHDRRNYIQMRIEVPEDKTLVLNSASFEVVTYRPNSAFRAEFPSASLVDTPIVNAFSSVPSLQTQQMPPTAALVGSKVQAGKNYSGRYFWFATYVDIKFAEEALITLPSFKVNDLLSSLPQIRFSRNSMLESQLSIASPAEQNAV